MADFNPEEIKQEPLGNPEPNLEPHTSNLSVSQASNSSRSRDRDRPRKVLRSERRVFIINLPFNESWQNLRDWIVEKTGADEPYITFINDPISNKFTGACHIEFKTLEEADKCAAMSTEEFKGRSLIINKDENNSHLKVWCRKKNYTFEMDARFKPVIKTLDGRQAAPTESSHGRRGKPDGFSRGGPPSGHPPPQMPPMAPAVPLGYDPFGKPLINDVTDLLASCVFFMNLLGNFRDLNFGSVFPSQIYDILLKFFLSILESHKRRADAALWSLRRSPRYPTHVRGRKRSQP